MKAVISGGGTGGHIFPAIAIANAIKNRYPDSELLFVGAEGRMEMEKVPAAGYRIEGLPIAGLQRKLTFRNVLKNLQLPVKLTQSRRKVRRILKSFNPDIVVGVGGFASEPTLKAATAMGYRTLIQEQNSYAGLTNKLLSKRVDKICVAYDNMERFFPAEKIVFTGNPVRADIENITPSREEGMAHFGISSDVEKVVLVVGGSLGARSINQMMLNGLETLCGCGISFIWQTGTAMYDKAVSAVESAQMGNQIKVHKFISRMDMAYAAASAIVSRAGAIAISELCVVGKPVVLIPSPNVAEDHQTKNAMALVDKQAALMVRDAECGSEGIKTMLDLLADNDKQQQLSVNIRKLARFKAADMIVDEIDKLLKKK